MEINILITSSGNVNGKRLLKSAQENSNIKNLKVYGTDIKKNTIKNIFHVPSVNSSRYFEKITKIINKYKIKLLVPGSDEEAIFFSKIKKKVQKLKCTICSIDYSILKNFSNKKSTYQVLNKSKIRSALWFESKNEKDLDKHIKILKEKNKEIVIKPVFSRGGRNVIVIHKRLKKIIKKNFGKEIHLNENIFSKTYKKKLQKLYPLITMEKLYEPAYDMDMLCWKGKLLKLTVRKRIGAQGIDGCIIEFNKPEFLNYAKKISRAFKLSWLYDGDLMFDKKRKPVLIELNPRISGSLYSCVENKINFIDDLVYLSLGKISKIKKIKLNRNLIVKK